VFYPGFARELVIMRWIMPWATPRYGLTGPTHAESLTFVANQVTAAQSVLTVLLFAHAIIPTVFHIHLHLHFAFIIFTLCFYKKDEA
jgi:hypothetical protein